MEDQQLTALPISKATNAYDFVDEVIAVMIDNPERVFMGDWVFRMQGKSNYVKETLYPFAAKLKPPCGTVACVSGWMAVLKRAPSWCADNSYMFFPPELYFELDEIFFTFLLDQEIGTPEYIEPVLEKLRAFRDRNEPALRNHELTPPMEEDAITSATGLGD